jgi:multimeric flavodoxin WrbA
MDRRPLVILGSARDLGHTRSAVDLTLRRIPHSIVFLRRKNILPYSYTRRDAQDDFIGIANRMARASVIVFATPVYWYSMSAEMKIF